MANGKTKKQPRNTSRIVVEGIDEPKREGRFSDKIKIDPFKSGWIGRRSKPQRMGA